MLVRALVLELLRLLLLRALGPPQAPAPDPGPDSDALKAAGEILKVSTGLATGALVFSVGLLPGAITAGALIRGTLAGTWVMLFLSVIGGVLAQSAIPVLLAERRYDIEAPTFTWPGRVHQVLFGLAILGLAVVLTASLYSQPAAPRIGSASHAVITARAALHPGEVPDRLDLVELIKGTDASRDVLLSWHVRFHLTSGATTDLMIDPVRGTITKIP